MLNAAGGSGTANGLVFCPSALPCRRATRFRGTGMKIDNGPLALAYGIVLGGLTVGFAMGSPVMDWVAKPENATHVQTIVSSLVGAVGISLVVQQLRQLQHQNSVALSALKVAELSRTFEERSRRTRALAALGELNNLLISWRRIIKDIEAGRQTDSATEIIMKGPDLLREIEAAVMPALISAENVSDWIAIADQFKPCILSLIAFYDNDAVRIAKYLDEEPAGPRNVSEAKELLESMRLATIALGRKWRSELRKPVA